MASINAIMGNNAKSKLGRLSKLAAATFLLSQMFASAAFAAPPSQVQITYEVHKGFMKIGEINEVYKRENNQYTLSSTTRAVGLLAILKPGRILISSSGLVGNKGLRPLHFSDKREGEEHRNRSADFDWSAKKLTLTHQTLSAEVPLPEGTQDRLSAMYQFMYLTLDAGTTLEFPMTNGSKLDNYRYAVSHKTKLATPAGEFETLYLDNQPEKGESRTEIWLATEHHNLPCKLTITDADGSQLTQTLSKFIVTP